MNIIFITQSVDEQDPLWATSAQWIKRMSLQAEVESLRVITLRSGSHFLSDNIKIIKVGHRLRIFTLLLFLLAIIKTLRTSNLYFIHGGGPYATILQPIRAIGRKKVVQWWTHHVLSTQMKFQTRWCLDLIFTATPSSFTGQTENLRVVGHGIDTDLFSPKTSDIPPVGIISAGRISSVKRLELLLNLTYQFKLKHGHAPSVSIYGPYTDKNYFEKLQAQTSSLQLKSSISFLGPITHRALPSIFSKKQIFVSYSETALDKALLEAMACGLPVISTNKRLAEILPNDLKEIIILDPEDPSSHVDKLDYIFSLSKNDKEALGNKIREFVIKRHSINHLFDSIFYHLNNG